jgi:hypothetical protein
MFNPVVPKPNDFKAQPQAETETYQNIGFVYQHDAAIMKWVSRAASY